ncbi:MAG TPA: hypothetical protein PKV75_10810 [Desulfobacterales bacterium]|nr:hypothetical protein [Desulfobacterales bacterium]
MTELGICGSKFLEEVTKDFIFDKSHDKQRLLMAARCLDYIDQAEQQIEQDGAFTKDRYGQVKPHPGQKVIQENKIIFCRIIRELGLDLETKEPPRPPKLY